MAPEPGHEYWLVDPLDGTREFAAMRDEFTVNIGLIREGRPVLGAVGVPAHGELFGGLLVPHPVAWKRTAAGEQAIRARHPPAGRHARAGQPVLGDDGQAADRRSSRGGRSPR